MSEKVGRNPFEAEDPMVEQEQVEQDWQRYRSILRAYEADGFTGEEAKETLAIVFPRLSYLNPFLTEDPTESEEISFWEAFRTEFKEQTEDDPLWDAIKAFYKGPRGAIYLIVSLVISVAMVKVGRDRGWGFWKRYWMRQALGAVAAIVIVGPNKCAALWRAMFHYYGEVFTEFKDELRS